jgi:DNA-binding MarR family transcriptional regulator
MVRKQPASGSPAHALEAVAYGAIAVTTRALETIEFELTFGQWRVLVIAGERDGGATVSDIAARLGSELSPASRLVGRMARRGLVTLVKDDLDRRITRVTLTSSGTAVRQAVLERRLALLREVLAGAGPVAPDVVAGLERIGEAFRRYS